ncbi:MAG: apolipoprotein N-acyltransferase [Micromonosporaceae bacterium]|nr:apolipoprotein N-acyltransferase [Micromonosporaceae bacterium]
MTAVGVPGAAPAAGTASADRPLAPDAEPATPAGTARWWLPVLLAAAGGAALLLAFPPFGAWWLAPVAVSLLALAAHGRRVVVGAGLGLLAGLVFFVPLLSWTNLHTGVLPWLLLSVAEALFIALLGAAAAILSPLVDRYPWLWPPLTGALWVGQEALRDRIPFGGFPWGRVAFSQADSPLLRYAALGGAPLVTFAVATIGGVLALAVLLRIRWRTGAVRTWAPTAALVLLGIAGFAVPVGQPGGATVTVAVVQGNVPRLGLDFNAQRRAVLDDHVAATKALADRVRAGTQPRPDLVVWPENASDIDPLVPGDADAAAVIDEAARAVGAPILVGAVLVGPGTHNRNVGLVWDPSTGPGQMYVKRHPVPFAEYMPAPLGGLAKFVSDQADLVGSYVPGDRPGVLRVGPATVGDVICFEVAYDDIVRDTVTGGAQLLAVQTNNATFDSAEAKQQLAMVRLRAVEHGRYALMASTVGVSALVAPDGRLIAATGFNTQASLVGLLRLGSQRTLASDIGQVPELVLAGLALAALVAAVALRRTRRRGSVPVVPIDAGEIT